MHAAKEAKDALLKELKHYEASIGALAPGELSELRSWVAAGNSAYDNPYCYAGENGHPLCFIEAARLAADMLAFPGDYGISP